MPTYKPYQEGEAVYLGLHLTPRQRLFIEQQAWQARKPMSVWVKDQIFGQHPKIYRETRNPADN